MAKLYYTPLSCGAASFIAAFTAGLSLECETVDLATHKTASGADFYAINVKGNVPALVLEDGTVLNEGSAVLQWIADQKPESGLAPLNGTSGRYLVQTALNYIASEVHMSVGGLLNPAHTEATRAFTAKNAHKKLDFLNNHLVKGKKFLVGDSYTIADYYLYIVLTWTKYVNIDLAPYSEVASYFNEISNLENVKNAHARMATNPKTTF